MSETQSTVGQGAPQGRGRLRRALWLALAVLVAALALAIHLGYAGFAWAHLLAHAFPRDEALLEHLPAGTRGVVVIDPHLLDEPKLRSPRVRGEVARLREAIEKATGIRVFLEVDKIALAPQPAAAIPLLVVARGRFDAETIQLKLSHHRYTASRHAGVTLLTGPDDALALDGDVIVYGDPASVKAALDARGAGTSFPRSSQNALARLSALGWRHGIVATASLEDDAPSLKRMVTGGTGVRAVSLAVDVREGLEVRALVEASSPAEADRIVAQLEQQKRDVASVALIAGPEAGALAADVAAAMRVSRGAGENVEVAGRLTADVLDRAATLGASLAALADPASLLPGSPPPATPVP